jgi:hypothetical protein
MHNFSNKNSLTRQAQPSHVKSSYQASSATHFYLLTKTIACLLLRSAG